MSDVKQQSNGLIWAVIFVVGAVMLVWSMSTSRTGQVWVTAEQHAFAQNAEGDWAPTDPSTATSNDISWTTYSSVLDNELTDEMIASGDATMSWSRTIGLWLAAIFTLFILSFLVGDNPAYKFAEAMVVGTSAGYVMVIGYGISLSRILLGV